MAKENNINEHDLRGERHIPKDKLEPEGKSIGLKGTAVKKTTQRQEQASISQYPGFSDSNPEEIAESDRSTSSSHPESINESEVNVVNQNHKYQDEVVPEHIQQTQSDAEQDSSTSHDSDDYSINGFFRRYLPVVLYDPLAFFFRSPKSVEDEERLSIERERIEQGRGNKDERERQPKQWEYERQNEHKHHPMQWGSERLDDKRKEQERKRQEQERKRLEQERKRLEQERKRQEQERKRQEQKRLEQERKRQEQERKRQEQERLERSREYENELFKLSSQICCENNTFFSLYTEKKQGLGEDSVPLIYSSGLISCVGVFDGMGGAGATEYPTYTMGSKTGAYLASRAVRAFCLDHLYETKEISNSKHLTNEIAGYLNKLLNFWNIRPSSLRSSVIRILPTTLAIIEAKHKGNNVEIKSYWAGDSRNYILSRTGLKQISVDDLRQPKDPLENLRNDDALSNCICQDKPFVINEKHCGTYQEPIIILSATDGCFGYLPTPMHFEYILLSALMSASDCKQWQDNVKSKLVSLSGDDFTLGLQILGGSIEYWKDTLSNRFNYLKNEIIAPIEAMKTEYENAIKVCKACEENLYEGITDLWNKYKSNYLPNT